MYCSTELEFCSLQTSASVRVSQSQLTSNWCTRSDRLQEQSKNNVRQGCQFTNQSINEPISWSVSWLMFLLWHTWLTLLGNLPALSKHLNRRLTRAKKTKDWFYLWSMFKYFQSVKVETKFKPYHTIQSSGCCPFEACWRNAWNHSKTSCTTGWIFQRLEITLIFILLRHNRTCTICSIRFYLLTEWRLTDWMSDWLACWVTDWLIIDWPHKQTNLLTDWLTDWLSD